MLALTLVSEAGGKLSLPWQEHPDHRFSSAAPWSVMSKFSYSTDQGGEGYSLPHCVALMLFVLTALLNVLHSFKLSGFVLLFTSLKTEQRILLYLCSMRVLLPKSLRSSSYVVCLCLKPNRNALSFTFSSFSAKLLLQKCQVCAQ